MSLGAIVMVHLPELKGTPYPRSVLCIAIPLHFSTSPSKFFLNFTVKEKDFLLKVHFSQEDSPNLHKNV
jgi:hypothetical protein